MNWTDEGIVLSARKHGESGAIVTLMTRENGRHAGMVRGGSGSRARGIYQTGNLVAVDWRARLSDHLGTYNCELLQANAALLMTERLQLLALSASAGLVERLMPEREPQQDTFASLAALIQILCADENWLRLYVEWELGLLKQLGYGLDLTRCAATGSTEDLTFVSPRSGCAVSYGPGRPYREKLFDLPPFFKSNVPNPTFRDIRAGLRITGYFLSRYAEDAGAGELPKSRARFIEQVLRNKGD